MPYIMQSTLLLLVPILFAITLYLTLSRVITAVHGQEQSPISVHWLNRETWVFASRRMGSLCIRLSAYYVLFLVVLF